MEEARWNIYNLIWLTGRLHHNEFAGEAQTSAETTGERPEGGRMSKTRRMTTSSCSCSSGQCEQQQQLQKQKQHPERLRWANNVEIFFLSLFSLMRGKKRGQSGRAEHKLILRQSSADESAEPSWKFFSLSVCSSQLLRRLS